MPDLIENEFNRKMLSIYLRSGGCNSSHRLKPPRLAKQGFVAGDAAAVAVAGRVVLGATCSAGRYQFAKRGLMFMNRHANFIPGAGE